MTNPFLQCYNPFRENSKNLDCCKY